MKAIRFLNTYEPVTDFYRDLLPILSSNKVCCEVVVSSAQYRIGRQALHASMLGEHARVRRIAAGVAHANNRIKKILVLVSFTFGALVLGLFGSQVSLNFFLTQPPLFAVTGRLFRRLRGQRYCCLVMDMYPQVLEANGILHSDNFMYRCFQRMTRSALRGADVVFVIGRCMRERLMAEQVDADRIIVVHNWANEQRIYPVPRSENPLSQKFGITDEFVVLYSGNMGIAHSFDTILTVARQLKSRLDIRFIFMGEGVRRADVLHEVESSGLTNVMVGDLQPESLLAFSQSLGDVHFVCLKKEFTGLVVPSKAYSTLAAGRAIIYEGSQTGEIALMISEENIGSVIHPGDVGALEHAIVSLADDRADCKAKGQRARDLALGKYGRDAAVNRYVDALSGIVASMTIE